MTSHYQTLRCVTPPLEYVLFGALTTSKPPQSRRLRRPPTENLNALTTSRHAGRISLKPKLSVIFVIIRLQSGSNRVNSYLVFSNFAHGATSRAPPIRSIVLYPVFHGHFNQMSTCSQRFRSQSSAYAFTPLHHRPTHKSLTGNLPPQTQKPHRSNPKFLPRTRRRTHRLPRSQKYGALLAQPPHAAPPHRPHVVILLGPAFTPVILMDVLPVQS
jgi:hypothetical protein